MPSDVERAIAAAEALEFAYRAVFAEARCGMTADQIDSILRTTLSTFGVELPADKTRITPFVVVEGGEGPKLRRNRVPLEAGKLWGMDNSVCRDGFWADLGRYGWFGDVPAPLVKDFARVVDRQKQVAAAIRPGVLMGEIYASIPPGLPFEVHRIADKPNMYPVMGDMMPGIRQDMLESDRQKYVFEPGMVICVELWAGLAGGIEDMYRVTDSGLERISTLKQELYVLPA